MDVELPDGILVSFDAGMSYSLRGIVSPRPNLLRVRVRFEFIGSRATCIV